MIHEEKIIFIYPHVTNSPDAVGVCIAELAETLTETGRLVDILDMSISERGGRKSWFERYMSFDRPLRMLRHFRFLATIFYTLMTLPRDSRTVAVIVDIPTGAGLIIRAAKIFRPKIIHIAWVMDLYRIGSIGTSVALRSRAYIEVVSLKVADDVVTLGSCMAANLVEVLNRPVHVIPIWQNEAKLFPARLGNHHVTVQSERVALDEATKTIEFLYSGSARRNVHPIDVVAEAFQKSVSTTRARLTIRGRGDAIDELRQRGFPTPEVQLLPPVSISAVQDSLAGADVLVVCLAQSETGRCVPSKTYAAMAVGRPILFLGDDKGQAAIDIDAAGCGIIVSETDPNALATAIEKLSGSIRSRDLMGNSGREFFLRERSLAVGTQRWIDHLEGILS